MATTAEKTPPKLLLAARAPALAGVEDVAGGDPVLEPVLIGVVIFAGAVPMSVWDVAVGKLVVEFVRAVLEAMVVELCVVEVEVVEVDEVVGAG
jgi:hypothetical protein